MWQWQWHAYDLRTQARLCEVSMAAWTHTVRLNDAGSWTGTLAPHDDADRVREVAGATLPARSMVIGIRDGRIEGDGIVWRRAMPELAGSGLLSFFRRRRLLDDVEYLGVDQHDMFADLVRRAQAPVGADIGVTSTVTPSGVLRDQTWRRWEAKQIAEALAQKAAVRGGPDFDVSAGLDEGRVVRRLQCWTPFRGRRWEDSRVTFTLGPGGNAFAADADEDGIATTTRAIALGEESDPATRQRPVATSTAGPLVAAGWPLLDDVLDLPDVDVGLQAHADGLVDLRGRPQQEEMTVRVDPSTADLWSVGDECMVLIPEWSAGSRPDPWRPDGLSVRRRIVGRRWEIDATGERLFAVTGPTVDD